MAELLTPFHLTQESGYNQILQNTSAIIYVRDRNGRFIFANQRFQDAFNLPLANILGKTCADLFPADIAEQYRINDERVLDDLEVQEFEESALLDGQEHTFISIKFPLFASDGEVFALCGISTDITGRKQKENLLYDVAVKLCSIPDETLFEDVVCYLSPRLNVDFAMIGQLPAGTDILNAIAASEKGQPVPPFNYPLQGTPCEQVIGHEFLCVPCNLQSHYPGDNMLKQAGFHSYAGYPLYDSKGTPLGLLAVTHRGPMDDIDFIESILKIFSLRVGAALERQQVEKERKQAEKERRQLERQLQQAQKMEAIGQLAGGFAHDFNNLLTGISGYISLAQEQLQQLPANGDNSRTKRYLERALTASHKASDLIQQMLTFSRGEHGTPRAVRIPDLLQEFMALMESSLPASVEVELHTDADLPALMLDPGHLEQVLMNLCINGRDAMNNVGRLTLHAHRVSDQHGICTSCQQPLNGDYVAIRVADTGSGIAPAVMERMFEPFYSTKATGRGSGMGLAMTHGIVHEYGGHVLVQSELGAGTEFTILLPTSLACSSIEPTAETGSPDHNRRLSGTVLVLDDQTVVSEFMQDLLSEWGLQVEVFNHPERALSYILQHDNADNLLAAIVDYTMPVMNGLEWTRQARSCLPQLPVILYSGYREEIDANACAELGIRKILRKPIDEQEIFQQLQAISERSD